MPDLRIQSADHGKAIELFIYDDIGPSWLGMIDGKTVATALAPHADAEVINVRINSIGGDVYEGTAIYNLLSRHSARVEVDVDGAAMSAASMIAMSGDVIRMASGSMMMIHEPWTFAVGDSSEMRRTADLLDKSVNNLVGIYTARTSKTDQEVREMLAAETYLTPSEAVDAGFADEETPAKAKISAAALRLKSKSNGTFGQRLAAAKRCQDQPSKDTHAMSITRESFIAAAKDHADWLTEASKPLIEASTKEQEQALDAKASELRAEGMSNERERCVSLMDAFAAHPQFARERIDDGSELKEAKVAAFDSGIGVKPHRAADEGDAGTHAVSTDPADVRDSPTEPSKMSEERRTQLLSQSPLGRSVLTASTK